MKRLADCRILLVDDTKANLEVLLAGLKDEFKLSVALNGEQALLLTSRAVPDLILLDVNMPGLDGYEVCRRLRARADTSEIPIVFVSALDEPANKALGFEVGANDYVSKPFDLLEVKARVRALLKAKAYNDAVKDQLAGELRIARDIQMGMLPHEFASIESAYGVKVAAKLSPAGEVGGDLFAVLDPDPDRLVMVVGDVSGKGIPAALFMVRTLSLVRLLARDARTPEEILSRLNNELAADNPSSMFVTLACAIYEPHNRRLFLASGGQTRPVLLRRGEPARFILENMGTALGLEVGVSFERAELTLEPSDTVVFYTDGVTEAFNGAGECYNSSRLMDDLTALCAQAPEALTTGLLQRVERFASGARQSDDIAVLAVCFDGQRSLSLSQPDRIPMHFNFLATPQQVMCAVEAFRTFAADQQLSDADVFAVSLGLEECASNIVQHAYGGDQTQRFSVRFQRTSDRVSVILNDTGIPFDRAALDELGPSPANESGGWGLHLARSFLDEIEYSRQDGTNVWRLTKHLLSPDVQEPVENSTLTPARLCL